ncbi:MAG: hypothetical protein GX594_05370 [Pirellulaceae bacterium]|nr:hypothetical protein [Pirellulaceae bacterium]
MAQTPEAVSLRLLSKSPNAPSPLSPLPSSLFAVRTPTVVVTDLGTEFGVEVEENGDTTSHVFQGRVLVQAGIRVFGESGSRDLEKRPTTAVVGGEADQTVMLVAGQSVRVGRVRETHHESSTAVGTGLVSGTVRFTQPTSPPQFARAIARLKRTYLDLADIVAGGDGFGDSRGRGIDAEDGRLLLRQPDEYKKISRGDGRCHAVEELPFIDCVFIPNGGLMPLNSAGGTTSLFPKTNNTSWNYIWSGQIVHKNKPENTISCWLDFVDYASPRHSVLSMPPNKGITFDLDAIRRANSEVEIVRFTAVAGNAETRSENRLSEDVSADLWVFVDGINRFKKTGINATDGALHIDIPLSPNDRFLTLATTDGGNSTDFDWTLFGDPRLKIKMKKRKQVKGSATCISRQKGEESPMKQ